mgnify:FL=1
MNEQDIVRSHTLRALVWALFCMLVCWTLLILPNQLPSSMRPDFGIQQQERAIVLAAQLATEADDVEKNRQAVQSLEVRFVELASGNFVEGQSNSLEMTNKDTMVQASRNLTPEADAVGLKALESVAPVYLKRSPEGRVDTIILPVRGYGVWSTLHGYLALKSDARSVQGLAFFRHAETRGLGARIDDPVWLNSWRGKEVLDATGNVVVKMRPTVSGHDERIDPNTVDAITGATWTSRCVENLLQFWLSEQGFGPFLARVRDQGV